MLAIHQDPWCSIESLPGHVGITSKGEKCPCSGAASANYRKTQKEDSVHADLLSPLHLETLDHEARKADRIHIRDQTYQSRNKVDSSRFGAGVFFVPTKVVKLPVRPSRLAIEHQR